MQMESWLAVYRIEFPQPKRAKRWSAGRYELALSHMLAEEELARSVDGEPDEGIRLGRTRVERVGPMRNGSCELLTLQRVRFDGDDPVEVRATRLRSRLASLLGLDPRQWEGPWNIIALRVEPAEEPRR
jgi:hypothetical protein